MVREKNENLFHNLTLGSGVGVFKFDKILQIGVTKNE